MQTEVARISQNNNLLPEGMERGDTSRHLVVEEKTAVAAEAEEDSKAEVAEEDSGVAVVEVIEMS